MSLIEEFQNACPGPELVSTKLSGKRQSQILTAIHILNAKAIKRYGECGGNLSEKEKDDYIEFADYYLDVYGYNDDLQHAIDEEFGGTPLVFRMAFSFQDERKAEEEYEEYLSLGVLGRTNADRLIEFIWKIRKNREITLVFGDGSYTTLKIEKAVPRWEMGAVKKELCGVIGSALAKEATLFLCLPNRDTQEVYGFTLMNDVICELSEREILRDYRWAEPEVTRIYKNSGIQFLRSMRELFTVR